MKTISLLSLVYSINFVDADDGDCYAGEGRRVISAHLSKESAEAIASEFNSIVTLAENEVTIFPIQKYNAAIEKRFGFQLRQVDVDGYDFKFVVGEIEVEP